MRHRLLLLVALTLAATALPRAALACPVCFGAVDSLMIHGMNNGILALLGVVFFVQGGFVALFVSVWRRGKHLRERRESFQLITGGKR